MAPKIASTCMATSLLPATANCGTAPCSGISARHAIRVKGQPGATLRP